MYYFLVAVVGIGLGFAAGRVKNRKKLADVTNELNNIESQLSRGVSLLAKDIVARLKSLI